MKFNILSDLHLDFWVKPGKTKTQKLYRYLDNLLDSSEEVEVLIVAGDLTHYPSQLHLLEKIAEDYNYKQVFCVLGNHDMYLVGQKQKHNFKISQNKVKAYYEFSDNSETVTILDGEIVEYDGVKIGGAMGWYDGTMNASSGYNFTDPVLYWKRTMNDANYIKGYQDFYDIWSQEKPKLESILEADIIITHVCPLSNKLGFQERYKYEMSSMFYAFDGENMLDKTDAKFWIFGHSHGYHDFEVYGTNCYLNTLGYPGESSGEESKCVTLEIN